MIYAGIGSRRTPVTILKQFTKLGMLLGKAGYTLRSGHAPGADISFENGCDQVKGKKEIYIPWQGFNHSAPWDGFMLPTNDAYVIAEKYHPAWTRCSPGAKKLHARNSHQILGKDLQTPCDFVVCWSDGSGGTEQALRIAKDYNVPIYNFYENGLEELKQRLTRAD